MIDKGKENCGLPWSMSAFIPKFGEKDTALVSTRCGTCISIWGGGLYLKIL